ncbi:hypothetical protein B5F76_01460 [Desulfovibrio sp. An276]|uniref:hypothetical protein n=1 Tax=Desulfovibrio sp. An276 TaxID=1965618 RepID=UPI000B365CEB|nr:hypothetical protein [Desulfovibrio sp. An276]OUO55303.1 hypothetical protein B5F76_01460 [Desulfovibrio sp. An276]
MKIVKRDLKFDMVLDGEKINSLEELREHPSTELLDFQQDGRLSRWVRAHGGTNEADQLSALSLSGDKAQDLYAICQILSIDIELKDIKDALKYEETSHINEKNISSDSKEELIFPEIVDDPKIDEWREVLLNNLSFLFNKGCEHSDTYYKDEHLILTNIKEFKDEKGCDFIEDTNLIKISNYNAPNCIALNSSDVSLVFEDDSIDNKFEIHRRAFITGDNVVIRKTDCLSESLCICAKNIYIDKLCKNTILIGENIFIESLIQEKTDSIVNDKLIFICAKNLLSIGKQFVIPPFSKTKEELLSDNTKIKRYIYGENQEVKNYKHKEDFFYTNLIMPLFDINKLRSPKDILDNLSGSSRLFGISRFNLFKNYSHYAYLCAETYLYGCEKEGISLETSKAQQCYKKIKDTFDIWSEINGIFKNRFWNMRDFY